MFITEKSNNMEICKVELKVIPLSHHPKTSTLHIKHIYITYMETEKETNILYIYFICK